MAGPSVSSFLRQLSAEARAAEAADAFRRAQRLAAEQAVRDAVHFGRTSDVIDDLTRRAAELADPPAAPPVRVPDPDIDPVSIQVATIGGPRRWAEERFWRELAGQDLSMEPLADQLARNERSRALINQRLDRLSPEQRQSSLGAIARDANRRAPRVANDKELAAVAAIAAAGGAGIAYPTATDARPQGKRKKYSMPVDDGTIPELPWSNDEPPMSSMLDVQLKSPPILVPPDDLPAFDTDAYATSILAEESSPGPAANISGYGALPDNDPAVQQAVSRLVRAGIPAERALGIATGRDGLSDFERQNVFYGAK